MQIHTTTSPAQDAARRVNDILDEHRHADVLLLLSGGSALSLLEYIDTTLLSDRVTVSVLDERYTQDERASNFSQLVATAFWERARTQHVQAIDPRPDEDETLIDASRRFDVALKHWHIIHREGIVLVTMGVGTDGHTSGILPHPHNEGTFTERFSHPLHCVVGYHIDPRIHPYADRMTTTLTYLLRHVHHAVVYVTGEEKRQALQALSHTHGTLHKTPARVLRDMQDVHVYTDVSL
jgi:6-phosphogluconolactonase/glucosamine-6-phosphate isomerase/deaminase